MQPAPNILIIVAILAWILAWICIRRSSGLKSVTFEKLSWWQKLVGIVALLCVVVVAVNPEFWALGLLGDTTFFDMFVLLMSIQLQMTLVWVWGWGRTLLSRGLRWMITPSPRWSHLMAAWTIGASVHVMFATYMALRRMAARSGILPFEGNMCG